MKLKINVEWVVELVRLEIAKNFETDEGFLSEISCGNAISDLKCTVVQLED